MIKKAPKVTSGIRYEVELDDELEIEDEIDWHKFSRVVVFASDWTTETVVRQLTRRTLSLDPAFQRRDAWDPGRKSRFIESLILGIPVPQIVLAEDKDGRYVVLDGKQRLLTLLHYWGAGTGANNGFALSGLEVRKDLLGVTLQDLNSDPRHQRDLRVLENQPIRTAVIRNWPNDNFLHLVFLRLNTGSLKLSPQELRQALRPGAFSRFVDEAAANSEAIRSVLHLREPDRRMRDIEILARFVAFRLFSAKYNGRMKAFLDETFDILNKKWQTLRPLVEEEVGEFEAALACAIDVFGDALARKSGSRQMNRAILDPILYFLAQHDVRVAAAKKSSAVKAEFARLVKNEAFVSAAERDTAGLPNTRIRFRGVGNAITAATGTTVVMPDFPGHTSPKRLGKRVSAG